MDKHKFSISLPVTLLKIVRGMARACDRSVNGQIVHMLKTYIANREADDTLKY